MVYLPNRDGERTFMAYNAYIQKEKIQAVICTQNEKIEGMIFKVPQNRLLDMLNHGEDTFIAVSNANVYCAKTGKLLFETEFLAVNKNHIVLIANATPIPEV